MDMTDVVERPTGWPPPLGGLRQLMPWLENRGLHATEWTVESPLIGFTVLILTGMGAAFMD